MGDHEDAYTDRRAHVFHDSSLMSFPQATTILKTWQQVWAALMKNWVALGCSNLFLVKKV